MRQQHRSRRHIVLSVALAAVIIAAAGWGIPGAAVRAQGANLLQNPGFEGGFSVVSGDDSLQVANNWTYWSAPAGGSSAINARPEYKPAPPGRVRTGSGAQEFNTFFATHLAGIYQRVPVVAGTDLRFSAHLYVWSSASFENPDVSDDPNDVSVSVGIDPTGGTNAQAGSVIWSPEVEFYDQYREVSITASAQASAVTVFVRSRAEGFVGTSNIYVDDAVLVPLGTTVPTETPVPTNTPVLTAVPTSTPPPTSPPAATNTPVPTNTTDPLVPTQEGTVTPSNTPSGPTPVIPTATPVLPSATPSLPDGFNSTVSYVVQAGDTVSGIAARYDSSVNAIITYNGLPTSGLIRVGQTLVVPVTVSYQPPPTFTPAPTQSGGTGGPTPPGFTAYTVRAGDTLYAISARYNSTVATLAQINNLLNPNLIYAGQVLQVPTGGTGGPTTPGVPPTVPPTGPLTHVVQPGENLFRIGLRYNVQWDVLARYNGLYNWNLLYPGQVLTIPR